MAEQVNTGKLRVLATTTRMRIEALPNVPTVAESGYKNYEVDAWWGMFAPANTPGDAVTQIALWFSAALQAPEVKSRLVAQGLYPVGLCGPEFAALLSKQYSDFGRIIHEANIKAE